MGLLKLIGCDNETRLREQKEREEQLQGFLRRKAAREREWNEEHGISEAAAAYAAPARAEDCAGLPPAYTQHQRPRPDIRGLLA